MTAHRQATNFLQERGISPAEAEAVAPEMVRFLRLLVREAERQERAAKPTRSEPQQKAKECREHSSALM